MTTRTIWPRMVFAVLACAAAALDPLSISGQNTGTEKFTGFAINMNSGPTTASIDFTIERWSTDAERQQLLAIIGEHKDPTAPLLTALQKLPRVGRIRTATSLGWDLRYAHQSPLEDGGRRIVLATDRPMGFREVRTSARTTDYPFTILEVRLGKDDQGEGKILAGTRVYVDKNQHLVLENYGQQPVRFNQIRKVK